LQWLTFPSLQGKGKGTLATKADVRTKTCLVAVQTELLFLLCVGEPDAPRYHHLRKIHSLWVEIKQVFFSTSLKIERSVNKQVVNYRTAGWPFADLLTRKIKVKFFKRPNTLKYLKQ
jgi:hypothetical protein